MLVLVLQIWQDQIVQNICCTVAVQFTIHSLDAIDQRQSMNSRDSRDKLITLLTRLRAEQRKWTIPRAASVSIDYRRNKLLNYSDRSASCKHD